jgi:hypothetical protein
MRPPDAAADRAHMARLTEIPANLRTLLCNGRGVFTAREAAGVGVSDDRLQRLVRADLLAPVARGVYASAEQLNRDPWLAHAIRTRGFVRASGGSTLATDWSAVAVRALFTIGTPPPLPTVARAHPARQGSSRTRLGQFDQPEYQPIITRCTTDVRSPVRRGWCVIWHAPAHGLRV